MVEQLDAMVCTRLLTQTCMHAHITHIHTCAHHTYIHTCPHMCTHIPYTNMTTYILAHTHPRTYTMRSCTLTQTKHIYRCTRVHTYILCTHAHTRTHTTHTTCMHAPHPTHFVDQSLTFAECTKTKHTTSHTYSYYIAFFNRNN